MENLQKANIYIIDIGAEKIVNPNWGIDATILRSKDSFDREIGLVSSFSNNAQVTINDRVLRADEYLSLLKEGREAISDSIPRTDFFQINEEERNSLYSTSLPMSLDTLKLKKLFPEELYLNGGKLYTDAIINITFDKASYEMLDKMKFTNKMDGNEIKTISNFKGKKNMETRKLREELYNEGVMLRFGDKLVEYVKYKRSASKAREGSHLFIKKELKEKMSDWDQFGIHYDDKDENVPLAAIKAYESLTSSGIEKTVTIYPNEILLIDDVVTKIKINASVTTEREDGEIIAEDDEEYEAKNIIWDGQSLADISLFVNNEPEEQKGMILLRNSFFKSCALNTNIQQWFDYKVGDKEYILDMFGRKVKRTDIKLITTPSSLKFLKFYDKFPGVDKNEKKKNCYEKWLEQLSSEFGVCKHESPSPFGEYHQLSYQIVNSLPLSKEDLKDLLEGEFAHIEKMKNDLDYFKSTIKFNDPAPSDALMLMLLEVNDKMWHTKMVKDYVRDKVDNYIANLRKGHIKIKGSDYAFLFGNPFEMLQYALNGKEADIKERPLIGKQVYCSRYETGAKLAGFRNPHITMGNVLVVDNIEAEEFKTFFNLTDNIVISNAYDSDIMYRLQGQDYDGDTVLLCSEPILVKAAEACQNDKFRVPINGIESEDNARNYTLDDEIDIDHKTAQNKIGEIVNLSQVCNSYYWHYKNTCDERKYSDLLKEYYTQTSILSSLSQIEIDRAKRDYRTNTSSFLNNLKKRVHNDISMFEQSQINIATVLSNDEKNIIEILKNSTTKKSFNTGNWLMLNHLIDENNELFFTEKDKRKIIEIVQSLGKEILDCGREIHEQNAQIADVLGTDVSFYDVPISKEGIKLIKNLIEFLCNNERTVYVRPKFFEYCGGGEQYAFHYFNTPMDYLQQIIDDDIPDKKRFKAVDIEDIIPKPDFRKADNHQIPKIIEVCTKANGYIKALQSKKNISEAKRYQQIREKEDEVIQKLSKWTINENTIRIMLYRAFSENNKYHDKNYSNMKRHLVSWLYQAQMEAFKEVIEISKGE